MVLLTGRLAEAEARAARAEGTAGGLGEELKGVRGELQGVKKARMRTKCYEKLDFILIFFVESAF